MVTRIASHPVASCATSVSHPERLLKGGRELARVHPHVRHLLCQHKSSSGLFCDEVHVYADTGGGRGRHNERDRRRRWSSFERRPVRARPGRRRCRHLVGSRSQEGTPGDTSKVPAASAAGTRANKSPSQTNLSRLPSPPLPLISSRPRPLP